jgi:hypothetical protein
MKCANAPATDAATAPPGTSIRAQFKEGADAEIDSVDRSGLHRETELCLSECDDRVGAEKDSSGGRSIRHPLIAEKSSRDNYCGFCSGLCSGLNDTHSYPWVTGA